MACRTLFHKSVRISSNKVKNFNPVIFTLLPWESNHMPVRNAGHSQAQNRAPQKAALAAHRSTHMTRLTNLIKAQYKITKCADPKKDPSLARIIAMANKANVGKKIGEFLKKLETRGEMKDIEVGLRGPNQAAILVKGHTDKATIFYNAVQTAARKRLVGYSMSNVDTSFTRRGIIQALPSDDLDFEKAEELAIECEAEEVIEKANEEGENVIEFHTSPVEVFKVKGALEKSGVNVHNFEIILEPVMEVEANEATSQMFDKFIDFLQIELDDFEGVSTNLKLTDQ